MIQKILEQKAKVSLPGQAITVQLTTNVQLIYMVLQSTDHFLKTQGEPISSLQNPSISSTPPAYVVANSDQHESQ